MRPLLFTAFGIPFYSYDILCAMGALVAILLTVREAKRRGEFALSPLAGLWVIAGIQFGSKVFFILQYESPWNMWRAFLLWQGGIVAYGGIIGGTVTLVIYARVHKLPLLSLLDTVAPYAALAHVFGRMGCFLNGCCWGRECDLPWAVRYPPFSYPFVTHLDEQLITSDMPHSLAVHPTPLYEAAGLLIISLALQFYFDRKPRAGAIALGYVFLYGLLRFLVEFARGDSARPVFDMTVSQLVSAALVVVAVSIWAVSRGRARTA